MCIFRRVQRSIHFTDSTYKLHSCFNKYNDIMHGLVWVPSSTKIEIETLFKNHEDGEVRLIDLKAIDLLKGSNTI